MIGTHAWLKCALTAAVALGGLGGQPPGGPGAPAAPDDVVDDLSGFRIRWHAEPSAWYVLVWRTANDYLAVGLLRADATGHVELAVGPEEAADLGGLHPDDVGLFPLDDIVPGESRRQREAVRQLEHLEDSAFLFFDQHLPLDEGTVEAALAGGQATGEDDNTEEDFILICIVIGIGEPRRPPGGGGSGPPPTPPTSGGTLYDPTLRDEVTV